MEDTSMEKSFSIFDLLEEAKKSGKSEEEIYNSVQVFLRRTARQTDTPYRGHFELTPLCNLDCKMCYVHLSEDQMQGVKLLPVETWISLMEQAIDAGMIRASLSGGECLTYPDFDDIFLFLKSQGISASVLTNGVLLNEKRIDFFVNHAPSRIQITLYGDSEDAYERVTGKRAFTTVVTNILAAKEAGLPVELMITPSRYMRGNIKGTIRLAKGLDVPYFISSGLSVPRRNTGRDIEKHDLSLDEYMDIFKYASIMDNNVPISQEVLPLEFGRGSEYDENGLRCSAGRSVFAIRWNGALHPCVQFNSIMADPVQNGFLSAWKTVNEKVKLFPQFKKCNDCVYSRFCSFCGAENENKGSRFYLNPGWCEFTWKMVENGLVKTDKLCVVDQ